MRCSQITQLLPPTAWTLVARLFFSCVDHLLFVIKVKACIKNAKVIIGEFTKKLEITRTIEITLNKGKYFSGMRICSLILDGASNITNKRLSIFSRNRDISEVGIKGIITKIEAEKIRQDSGVLKWYPPETSLNNIKLTAAIKVSKN